jgi:hypothetical protein
MDSSRSNWFFNFKDGSLMMSSLPFYVKKYGRNNGDLCKITLELFPRLYEEVSMHLKAPSILFSPFLR